MFHAGAICLTLSEFGGYPEHLNSAVYSLSRAFQCGPKTMPIAGALLAQANSCSRNTHKSVQPLRLAWTLWPAGTLLFIFTLHHFVFPDFMEWVVTN